MRGTWHGASFTAKSNNATGWRPVGAEHRRSTPWGQSLAGKRRPVQGSAAWLLRVAVNHVCDPVYSAHLNQGLLRHASIRPRVQQKGTPAWRAMQCMALPPRTYVQYTVQATGTAQPTLQQTTACCLNCCFARWEYIDGLLYQFFTDHRRPAGPPHRKARVCTNVHSASICRGGGMFDWRNRTTSASCLLPHTLRTHLQPPPVFKAAPHVSASRAGRRRSDALSPRCCAGSRCTVAGAPGHTARAASSSCSGRARSTRPLPPCVCYMPTDVDPVFYSISHELDHELGHGTVAL